MMKKCHIAITTDNIATKVIVYSNRLGAKLCLVIPSEYSLWRTGSLNVSIRRDSSCAPGSLRHLGEEDSAATAFAQDTDLIGIVWVRFNADDQARN